MPASTRPTTEAPVRGSRPMMGRGWSRYEVCTSVVFPVPLPLSLLSSTWVGSVVEVDVELVAGVEVELFGVWVVDVVVEVLLGTAVVDVVDVVVVLPAGIDVVVDVVVELVAGTDVVVDELVAGIDVVVDELVAGIDVVVDVEVLVGTSVVELDVLVGTSVVDVVVEVGGTITGWMGVDVESGGDTTGGPVGGVPVAVAVLSTEPASTSDCLIV